MPVWCGPMAEIAAIVLAAGCSARAGPVNKLLHPVAGRPMLLHAVDAALSSRAAPVIVVTGHEADAISAALAGRDVVVAHNPDYAAGLSTSLRAGLAALPERAAGAVVLLGDMPRIRAEHVDRLIRAWRAAPGASACVPVHAGRRGNPVLWSRACFADLVRLRGDRGGGRLLRHIGGVRQVDMDDDAVLFDMDRP